VHSKYPGTGDADTSRLDWLTGQHRDTYASILGHSGLQLYMAAAESHSLARVRYNLMEVWEEGGLCGFQPFITFVVDDSAL
jgi:splicing factor 3B subunit 5